MKNALNKLLFVLDSNERKKSFILTFLVLIGAILEMLGIGMLIPILSLLTDNGANSVYLEKVKEYLPIIKNFDKYNLIILSLASIFIVYLLKTIFLSFLTWYQSLFIFNLNSKISRKLFKNYLYKDYTFYLKTNSSKLVQNINVEVGNFIYSFALPLIIFITELLIILGISILLMTIEFKGFFLILILFGVFSFVYLFITRKKLKKIASERVIHQTLSVKDIQQGISSIKDVKVLGKEKEFYEYFKFHINNYTKMAGKTFFMQNLPKFILELFAVVILIIAIIFLINSDYEIGNIIIIVGMFAAASFKILPGVNRIMNSFVTMRYGYASLEEIYKDLQTETKKINYIKNNIQKKLQFKNSIQFKNIYYSYPENKEIILDNINLEIKANTTIGLLGESGSGKTTFVDLLTGILNPTVGEIKVDEKDISSNIREWQNNIGYIPQFIYLIDDTIKNNIAFGIKKEIIDINKIENALEVSQMKDFIQVLPKKIETKVGEFGVRLSGGQRQRIGIARALYNNPNLLVMDEATNSLDEETEKKVMNSIYLMKGKKTILISSHKKSILDKCDIILKFESGKITLINNK